MTSLKLMWKGTYIAGYLYSSANIFQLKKAKITVSLQFAMFFAMTMWIPFKIPQLWLIQQWSSYCILLQLMLQCRTTWQIAISQLILEMQILKKRSKLKFRLVALNPSCCALTNNISRITEPFKFLLNRFHDPWSFQNV